MQNINQLASEYLAFRCTTDLLKNTPAAVTAQSPCSEAIPTLVHTVEDIDASITRRFQDLKGKRLGIMLSGGMDSACLASYMPGCDAFTFRFQGGTFQREERHRAESFAKYYNLKLHYVDISWENTVQPYIDCLMKAKGAPVHSIEPQLLQATKMAREMGIDCMVVGESADLIFGGMDGLLSEDWDVAGISRRYTFCPPALALKDPVDVEWVYRQYEQADGKIDLLRFMDEVFSVESSDSYTNAFRVGGMEYCDPYAHMKMADPLDLQRVRSGESKYLIRALFAKKYPTLPIPNKVPMPRPVDFYFQSWDGPTHPLFRERLDMNQFTGNQKWQLWCLDHFLHTATK